MLAVQEREAEYYERRDSECASGSTWPTRRSCATLFKFSEFDHVLLMTVHHIAADGWSLAVLASEIEKLYAAFNRGMKPFPELPFQFVDYVAWYRQAVDEQVVKRQLAWWMLRLKGPLPVLELPSDRSRPPVMTDRGGVFVAPSTTSAVCCSSPSPGRHAIHGPSYRVQDSSSSLHGAEGSYRRHCGRRSEPVRSGKHDRAVHQHSRCEPASRGSTVAELLDRVRDTALGAFAHVDVPLTGWLLSCNLRDSSHSPVIQVDVHASELSIRRAQAAGFNA